TQFAKCFHTKNLFLYLTVRLQRNHISNGALTITFILKYVWQVIVLFGTKAKNVSFVRLLRYAPKDVKIVEQLKRFGMVCNCISLHSVDSINMAFVALYFKQQHIEQNHQSM